MDCCDRWYRPRVGLYNLATHELFFRGARVQARRPVLARMSGARENE
jgi:hypothetical protein